MLKVYVLPTRTGEWEVRQMSARQHRRWLRSWMRWWRAKGHRLAVSPEMWQINGLGR